MADTIQRARDAGYSDDEINAYLAPKMSEALAAGYTQDEINEHLGIEPPKPKKYSIPFKFTERFNKEMPMTRMLNEAQKWGTAAFGTEPLGLSDDSREKLKEMGIFGEKGNRSPLRLWNEALADTVAPGLDLLFRGIGAGLAGTGGFASQTVKEAGLDQGEGQSAQSLGRDIKQIGEMAMLVMGDPVYGKFSRVVEDRATGTFKEQPVGGLPDDAAFSDASKALVPIGDRQLPPKLKKLWEEEGIHPAEVAADSVQDVTIIQDLAAANRDVPVRYGGSGEPPKPPAGKVALVKEPEAPPPKPVEGSVEAAREKVLSRISVGEERAQSPYTWERLYTDMIDDLNPIRVEVDLALGKGKLDVTEDPYTLFRLTRGTYGKADQMLERGTFDFNTYATNGRGLREIISGVDDLDNFRAYAAAERAIEYEKQGMKTGIDLEAARQVISADKRKYGEVLDDLVEFQNRVTKYLRDSGVVSKKGYDAMIEANKKYVPFFRIVEEDIKPSGAGGGLGARNPIKAREGSERMIVDPLESIIKNTYTYVALAEKNAAGLRLVDVLSGAKRAPVSPGSFKIEQPLRPQPEGVSKQILEQRRPPELPKPEIETVKGELILPDEGKRLDLRQRLEEEMGAEGMKDIGGASFADDLAADLEAIVRTNGPLDGKTIRVLRDGKVEEYKVGEDLARAYQAADRETMGILIRMLAAPARALRAGVTLTPDFMARNLSRDFLTAFVNSKGLFSPLDTVKGFLSVIKKDKDFENWMKGGGANSAMVSLDRTYLQENIFKLNEETGLASRAWNVVKSPIAALRVTSELLENSTRMGEFKKVYDQHIKAGKSEKAATQAAAFASREVTLDFSRMGAKMRAWNMISAFLNANIQGVDRTFREAAARPGNFAAKVTAGITLPSLLLWYANRDDKRVKDLPRWEKDMFWIVPTDKVIYRVPKPIGLGQVFGSLPERLMDGFVADNPDWEKDLEKTMIASFVPPMLPTAVAPLFEQWGNRSLFTDGPLIPSRLEKLMPEYQYNDYTTELSKRLGSLMGAFPGMTDRAISDKDTPLGGVARALSSPILIENYVRAWTGGLGQYALQIADYGARQAGVIPDPVRPTKTLADIPVVKAFIVRYPSAGLQPINDFYDRFEENQTVWATVMDRAKQGDLRAATIVQERGGQMLQATAIKQTMDGLSGVIHLVNQNPKIPADEKRQIIDTAYFRMSEIAAAGNTMLREAKRAFAARPTSASMEEGRGTQ